MPYLNPPHASSFGVDSSIDSKPGEERRLSIARSRVPLSDGFLSSAQIPDDSYIRNTPNLTSDKQIGSRGSYKGFKSASNTKATLKEVMAKIAKFKAEFEQPLKPDEAHQAEDVSKMEDSEVMQKLLQLLV